MAELQERMAEQATPSSMMGCWGFSCVCGRIDLALAGVAELATTSSMMAEVRFRGM
jgi:hypothetical protein